MGCSCKVQLGQAAESEVSHVVLKLIDEKSPFAAGNYEDKTIDVKPENSIIKPNSLCLQIPLQEHMISPEFSKIDIILTPKARPNIIQEGELKKYRPGFKNQFISRWGVLTPELFMYFKNRGSAQIWRQAPLYSVNVNKISTASKVSYKIKGSLENSVQFEVFLKAEDPLVNVSRQTHKMPLMKSLIDLTSSPSEKKCVVRGMLMKRPLRFDAGEKDTGENMPAIVDRVSWSVREVQWFSSEKRLLFVANSKIERDFWVFNIGKVCSKD